MRALVLILAPTLGLAACNEATDPATPEPAATASAVDALQTPEGVSPAAPAALAPAGVRRVCQAALAAIHGQPAPSVEIDSLEAGVVTAAWRAPVDGGRLRAQCRVEGDRVLWRPLDRPDPAQNRWMNQAGDPVARFVLEGEVVTINQTLPDGTTATDRYVLASEQEAR